MDHHLRKLINKIYQNPSPISLQKHTHTVHRILSLLLPLPHNYTFFSFNFPIVNNHFADTPQPPLLLSLALLLALYFHAHPSNWNQTPKFRNFLLPIPIATAVELFSTPLRRTSLSTLRHRCPLHRLSTSGTIDSRAEFSVPI